MTGLVAALLFAVAGLGQPALAEVVAPEVECCRVTPTSAVDDLLGASDEIVVLGRQADTAVAQNWPGHTVLDTPNWSLQLSDDFIGGALAKRRTVYIASPSKGSWSTTGRFAGQPTVFCW